MSARAFSPATCVESSLETPAAFPYIWSMALEIFRAGKPSQRPPLLFVHGSFCGGWVWAEHFLPFFAEAGWNCLAVSLRGHGQSDGRKQLDSFTIADYVADVAEAAAECDRPPVVIGHSMGGIVAQRFVRTHKAAGLALLAPTSLSGLGGSFLTMSVFHPSLLRALGRVQTGGMEAADFDAIRRGLFSQDFPIDVALRYLPLFQRESLLANAELMAPQWLTVMGRPRLPALVIGGRSDCFVPSIDVRTTAIVWGADTHIVDDIPHAMMLDTSWPVPAGILAEWLGRSFGGT
ncbi:pimeloyl-ACP methyl ester carboxylesterase [Roseiarcus fermentans]|uniref:Pimeloyl-ACP methyl ester carboxylesterase n=2 Tax=Roseiarcus fermentans TaxID=1473586 RepID=A0A366FQ22_9HYPH|nr:pimeloyl-ACP methyl ester carboxylesterase [Roseiarcus fermentans]